MFIFGQNQIDIDAKFDIPNKTISIKQHIRYQNTSNDTLQTIYLNDWNNAYSSKKTPLAERFAEEFSTKFHFAKSDERGYTVITSLINELKDTLTFSRLKEHPDVIEVTLAKPLNPSESYDIYLNYNCLIPNDSFTNYGVTSNGELNLKYWYITPAVYNGAWQYYSNKNLDDMYIPAADVKITAEFPFNYALYSELDKKDLQKTDSTQILTLFGKDRVDTKLFLNKFPKFRYTQTDKFTLITDIREESIEPNEKALVNDRIVHFIDKNLGSYPHTFLMLTDIEYGKDQLYGLN